MLHVDIPLERDEVGIGEYFTIWKVAPDKIFTIHADPPTSRQIQNFQLVKLGADVQQAQVSDLCAPR